MILCLSCVCAVCVCEVLPLGLLDDSCSTPAAAFTPADNLLRLTELCKELLDNLMTSTAKPPEGLLENLLGLLSNLLSRFFLTEALV